MKKRFLLLVFSFYFLIPQAQAQITLAGLVGYRQSAIPGAASSDNSGAHLLSFTARLGFSFGERIELGLQPVADYSVCLYQTGVADDQSKTWQAVTKYNGESLFSSIMPYLRLRLLGLGPLGIGAEVRGDLAWGDSSRWGVMALPVVSCRFSDHWQANVYLDMFTFGYSSTTEDFRRLDTRLFSLGLALRL